MKNFGLALLLVAITPLAAFCESRLIAIDVRVADDAPEPFVSIYSQVKDEQRSRIRIQEAAEVISKAQGWGSMVFVGVQAHDVPLSKIMPILNAINQNGTLMLAFVEASMRPSFIHANLKKMIAKGRKTEAAAGARNR